MCPRGGPEPNDTLTACHRASARLRGPQIGSKLTNTAAPFRGALKPPPSQRRSVAAHPISAHHGLQLVCHSITTCDRSPSSVCKLTVYAANPTRWGPQSSGEKEKLLVVICSSSGNRTAHWPAYKGYDITHIGHRSRPLQVSLRTSRQQAAKKWGPIATQGRIGMMKPRGVTNE